jgi:antitoxin (DNA-binding transcriptional repressor) of toxin-antitoxin stability system
MYIVKKYTVSLVRERLAQALDEAQRGEPVFIQRDDVLYRLSVEPPPARARARRKPQIDVLDEAIEKGQWTWDWSGAQLTFRSRRRK